jgi:hypothetical protein
MSEKTVAEESVSKALETLQDLAKGHNSRGTATTNVESMRDAGAGAGSDSGSTQVFHTGANSDPGTWAGTGQRKSPEDGATDGVSEDGTDYSGSAEMVKSVMEKAASGQSLNDIDKAILAAALSKGGMFTNFSGTGKKSKDADDDDKNEKVEKACDDKDDDDKDDKKNPFAKSLEDAASDNEDVAKGLEVSSFLSGWAGVQSEALSGVESRIAKSIQGAHTEQRSYNAELAKSIVGLAEVLTLQSQRIEQLESTPARAPKSATAVEKSFGSGGDSPQGEEQLSKSQVLDTMTRMVESGELSATEVVKFESTNTLSPEMDSSVRAYRLGR